MVFAVAISTTYRVYFALVKELAEQVMCERDDCLYCLLGKCIIKSDAEDCKSYRASALTILYDQIRKPNQGQLGE